MCCVRSGYIFFVRINVVFCPSTREESSQSKRLLFSQNLNFIHKKLVPFDVNSFYFLLVEKLFIEYPMVVRDCIHQWRKRLVIEKPTKNGLQIVTGKKKPFTFKWRFKYLFALNNGSEQILSFSLKLNFIHLTI